MPKRENALTGSRKIIDEYGIEVIPLKASYVANAGRRVLIADGDESCGVEEYACRHFNRLGYSTTLLENGPIHVLFATYMWPVVQDASDRRSRIVGFFDRAAYDARIKCKPIWTRLPADFGKPEYAARRVKHINQHIAVWQLNGRSYGAYSISGSARAAILETICGRTELSTSRLPDS
jgi:hypothetical protein